MLTAYTLLKLIHVVAAICWIGGGLMTLVLIQQARNSGNAQEMASLLGRTEALGKKFFAPMSVLVLLAGIGMAVIGGLFAAPWVSFGFLGIFVSAGIGMGYLTPKGGQLKALVEQHGLNHPEVAQLGNQMMLVARIDMVILMLVVAAMVLKPGY